MYRDQTICQVVAYRKLKQRRIIELLSKVLRVAYERCCLREILIIESFDGKIVGYGRWSHIEVPLSSFKCTGVDLSRCILLVFT